MVQKDKQRMWRNVYLLVNVIGLLVFIGVGFLFSKKKKDIDWRSVLIMLVINLVLA
ncbi:Na+ dependent nucleoside transporter N-terminal domain-containing protein [Latilactobacillus sakei]|uniref:Na+ dependent nucleoside transporter N-terminal domain-containing protein n=1 Tax=Latilactobacillus sakei TaxID=1599 RepID=UPI003B3A8D67